MKSKVSPLQLMPKVPSAFSLSQLERDGREVADTLGAIDTTLMDDEALRELDQDTESLHGYCWGHG